MSFGETGPGEALRPVSSVGGERLAPDRRRLRGLSGLRKTPLISPAVEVIDVGVFGSVADTANKPVGVAGVDVVIKDSAIYVGF